MNKYTYDNKAIIISAFPATGKSTFKKEHSDIYNICDLDSSMFSWKELFPIKIENDNFVDDYFNYITKMRDECEILFISIHEGIKKKLTDEKISFITIYPDKSLLNEYIGRMYRKNKDTKFINEIIKLWDVFQNDVLLKRYMGYNTKILNSNNFISLDLVKDIIEEYNQRFKLELKL